MNKPWTHDEDRNLRAYYQVMTISQVAEKLQRSKGSIQKRLAFLGIKKGYPPYSKKEINFIKDNYKVLNNKQIGDRLGRSAASIRKKRCSLGLHRTPQELLNIQRIPNTGWFKKGVRKCDRRFQDDLKKAVDTSPKLRTGNTEKKVKIVLDDKTVIYISPGKDEEKAREYYNKLLSDKKKYDEEYKKEKEVPSPYSTSDNEDE